MPLLMCARPLMGGRAAPPPRGGLGRKFVPDPLWGAGLPRPPVGGWGGICWGWGWGWRWGWGWGWGDIRAVVLLLGVGVGFGRIYGTNKGLRQSEGVLGRVKND